MPVQDEKKVMIRLRHFSKYFPLKKKSVFDRDRKFVRANEEISLDIYEGETLGLVGESGCGKSTLGRTLLALYPHSAGYVTYGGRSIYEFAPAYAERILKNLPAEIAGWNKLREEAEKKLEHFRSLPEEEQRRRLPVLEGEIREERDHFYVLTQLLGGLLACEDVEAVQKAVLEEYQAGVRANRPEAAEEDRRAFAKASAQTEELRESCRELPGFAEYEENQETGLDLAHLTAEELRRLRKDLQIIFQDPYSSLDARMTIGQIIGEGLLTHHFFEKNGEEMQAYIMAIMEECGLAPYFFHRYPHQFSGGQRQRVGIARSLALKPKFIVCDEAVSALDVSIQSQILNLLQELKQKENLTYLFISHDLSVVKYISDRICVMYLGSVVELAETEQLFARPLHPYTQALLAAIPEAGEEDQEEGKLLEGDIPSPVNPPAGCKFHTRCEYCTEECKKTAPPLSEAEPGHFVACHHAAEIYRC